MSVKSRILEYTTFKCVSMRAFSLSIGKSENYISSMRKSIQPDIVSKIAEVYPDLNTGWLMTGEGKMLRNNATSPAESDWYAVTQMNGVIIKNVPLVGQYAQAGYLSGFADEGYIDALPKIPFIVDTEGKGHYIAFEVRGDSMNNGTEDSYLDGDRLLCREIAQHLWISSKLHLKKWDFIIVHQEGVLLKRITEHDTVNHTITIHSLSPEYPDRVINLVEVKQIFNVIEMNRPRRR